MSRREPLPEPVDFGKYQLIERIARGRMGEVFKAKRGGVEGFEKVLVVKKLNQQLTSSEHFVNTFVEEAKLTVSLSHANIVQVMDLGQHDGEYFMAMEHVAGYDLGMVSRILKAGNRPFPLEIAVFAISEVAKGLDYAHRRKDYNFESLNIVHRDLCPANVLVSFEGEVKITDFGISRALEVVEGLNESGSRHFRYASPEQARSEALTHHSDIFSLGLILYELVSGIHPYDDPDPNVVRQLAVKGEVKPIRDVVELPKALEQIIDSSLVSEPHKRVDSAGTLYEELISYLFASGQKADNRSLSLFMQDSKLLGDELFEKGVSIAAPPDLVSGRGPEAEGREESLSGFEGVIELDPEQLEVLDSDLFSVLSEDGKVATAMQIPVVELPARTPVVSRFDQGAAAGEMPERLGAAVDALVGGAGAALLLADGLSYGRDYLPDRLPASVVARGGGAVEVLSFVAVKGDEGRPYGLAAEFVRYTAGLAPGADPTAATGEVENVLKMKGFGLSEEEVEVALNLCGHLETYNKGFHAKRDLTIGLVVRLANAIMAHNPLTIMVEGFERLDALSKDLVFHLCGMTRQVPLMVVLSTGSAKERQMLIEADHEGHSLFEVVLGIAPEVDIDETSILDQMNPQSIDLLTGLSIWGRPLSYEAVQRWMGIDEARLDALVESIAPTGALRLVAPSHLALGNSAFSRILKGRVSARGRADFANRLLQLCAHAGTWISPLTWVRLRLLLEVGRGREALRIALQYGELLIRDGWREVALEHLTAASDLFERSSGVSPRGGVELMMARSRVALELMHVKNAAAALEGLSGVAADLRQEGLILDVRCAEAELALLVGQGPRALGLLESVIDSGAGEVRVEVKARLLMAEWMAYSGDLRLGQEQLEVVFGQVDAHGFECISPKACAEAFALMVEVLVKRGAIVRAMSFQSQLEQLALSRESVFMTCLVSLGRAHLARANGQPAVGALEAEKAYNVAREHNFIRLGLRLVHVVAITALEARDTARTRSYSEHLVELGERYGHVRNAATGRHLSSLSLVLTSTGDSALDALQELHGVLNQAQRGDDARANLNAHHLLFRALTHLGSGRDAEHHRREAMRFASLCHVEGHSIFVDL